MEKALIWRQTKGQIPALGPRTNQLNLLGLSFQSVKWEIICIPKSDNGLC